MNPSKKIGQALIAGCCLILLGNTQASDIWNPDPLLGDYEGEWSKEAKIWPKTLVAQVIPRGETTYVVHFFAEFDQRCPLLAAVRAKNEGAALILDGEGWSGRIENGVLTGNGLVKAKAGAGEDTAAAFALKKVTRPAPCLGAKPPEGAIVLFDGSGFDHWIGIGKSGEETEVAWKLVDGDAMEAAPTLDDHSFAASIGTREAFRDYRMHIEFRLPLFPGILGQSRGNSGIIFEDYSFCELQVLDSYGLPGYYDECGAIYKKSAPQVNMCRPPLEWQCYDIVFHGPRYARDGALLRPASITVDHNGKRIQTGFELPDTPGALKKRQSAPGSCKVGRIKLQNHGDPVQYRNIWLQKLPAESE